MIETTLSTDDLLRGLPGYLVSVMLHRNGFSVSGYVSDDMMRDERVSSNGATVFEAVKAYRQDFAAKVSAGPLLKTPADVKAAVVELIREHDAAPVAFRDAVDALRVSDR